MLLTVQDDGDSGSELVTFLRVDFSCKRKGSNYSIPLWWFVNSWEKKQAQTWAKLPFLFVQCELTAPHVLAWLNCTPVYLTLPPPTPQKKMRLKQLPRAFWGESSTTHEILWYFCTWCLQVFDFLTCICWFWLFVKSVLEMERKCYSHFFVHRDVYTWMYININIYKYK